LLGVDGFGGCGDIGRLDSDRFGDNLGAILAPLRATALAGAASLESDINDLGIWIGVLPSVHSLAGLDIHDSDIQLCRLSLAIEKRLEIRQNGIDKGLVALDSDTRATERATLGAVGDDVHMREGVLVRLQTPPIIEILDSTAGGSLGLLGGGFGLILDIRIAHFGSFLYCPHLDNRRLILGKTQWRIGMLGFLAFVWFLIFGLLTPILVGGFMRQFLPRFFIPSTYRHTQSWLHNTNKRADQ